MTPVPQPEKRLANSTDRPFATKVRLAAAALIASGHPLQAVVLSRRGDVMYTFQIFLSSLIVVSH
jgi:hypothetical protein